MISTLREEHRCLVTDELYSFPVTSCHTEYMTQMSFYPVTFILPSRQVTGHSCGKIYFLSAWKGEYKPVYKLWVQGSRNKEEPIQSFKAVYVHVVYAYGKNAKGPGDWTKGKELERNLSVPCTSQASWGPNRGSYGHLPPTTTPYAAAGAFCSFLSAVACATSSAQDALPPTLWCHQVNPVKPNGSISFPLTSSPPFPK